MGHLLIRLFIKDYEQISTPNVREQYGLLGSYIGIILNIFLCLFKIAVGMIFNSISILADGLNNLSDAGSSIITLLGFKLASRPADEGHPYGHQRIEYLSGLAVSFIILLLGIELIKSSIKHLFSSVSPTFSFTMVIVLITSIAIKLWLYLFNKDIGKKINSSAMIATATDSLNDVIATSSVLLALIISKYTSLNLDSFMGILVGGFVCYSSITLIKETVNPLLGEAPSPELVEMIKKKLIHYETISGFHDLVIHSYGPNRIFATVHAEVPSDADLLKCHDLIDSIEKDFSSNLNIDLVIHLDPIVTNNAKINELKYEVEAIVSLIDKRLSIHDFRVIEGHTHTNLVFDVVAPADLSPKELAFTIDQDVKKLNPNYYTVITVDVNYSSTSISSFK